MRVKIVPALSKPGVKKLDGNISTLQALVEIVQYLNKRLWEQSTEIIDIKNVSRNKSSVYQTVQRKFWLMFLDINNWSRNMSALTQEIVKNFDWNISTS